MISNNNILDDFAIKFSNIIKKHTKYIIVSGYVAISSGRTRATEDIDMIIKKQTKDKFALIHNDLVKGGFECIQSQDSNAIFEYLDNNDSVRYVLKDKMLPEMELKFSKDELDEYQLTTKTKLPLTQLDLWFSNINVNIAFKEYLLKSDKDMEDSKHLRTVYEELVNESEINHVKKLIEKCRLQD